MCPSTQGPDAFSNGSRNAGARSCFLHRATRPVRAVSTFRYGTGSGRKHGIEDVRLHDLRHTLASHAVMNGVPVPVVSRLLGHSNVRMTLRYAHLGDREIEAAAESIGQSIGAMMDL